MPRQLAAKVIRNTPLRAPGHHVILLDAPDFARDARPGHFVTAACGTGPQILRRPFSIFETDLSAGTISLLFSVYGPTTSAMAALEPGDALDIIGPLGGHVFAPDVRPGSHHVLVGGGYGVPPLALLARHIKASDPSAPVTLITGARTEAYLVGTDGLENIGVVLNPCTDDGSCGFHGLVTGVLETVLQSGEPAHVYTCGPTPMMRAVGQMAQQFGVSCQVSLEVFMPCGIGICMGCAVPLRGADGKPTGTYARGCTDGPVFEAREVAW